MAEGTQYDPTDTGTLRPNATPLEKKGTRFEPMECPDFDMEIQLPPHACASDPITLFTLYFPPEIIQSIVQCTNNYQREPRDPTKLNSRVLNWRPTCEKEIYVFLSIKIYMTVFPLNRVEDYWDTRSGTPYHHITKYMARDRFQELKMRYRICGPETTDIYQRVSLILLFGFKY